MHVAGVRLHPTLVSCSMLVHQYALKPCAHNCLVVFLHILQGTQSLYLMANKIQENSCLLLIPFGKLSSGSVYEICLFI